MGDLSVRTDGFTLSEVYAGSEGMVCEVPGCSGRSFTVYLRPGERVPEVEHAQSCPVRYMGVVEGDGS